MRGLVAMFVNMHSLSGHRGTDHRRSNTTMIKRALIAVAITATTAGALATVTAGTASAEVDGGVYCPDAAPPYDDRCFGTVLSPANGTEYTVLQGESKTVDIEIDLLHNPDGTTNSVDDDFEIEVRGGHWNDWSNNSCWDQEADDSGESAAVKFPAGSFNLNQPVTLSCTFSNINYRDAGGVAIVVRRNGSSYGYRSYFDINVTVPAHWDYDSARFHKAGSNFSNRTYSDRCRAEAVNRDAELSCRGGRYAMVNYRFRLPSNALRIRPLDGVVFGPGPGDYVKRWTHTDDGLWTFKVRVEGWRSARVDYVDIAWKTRTWVEERTYTEY